MTEFEKQKRPPVVSLRWRMFFTLVGVPLLVMMPIFIFIGIQYRNSYRDAFLGKGDLMAQQLQLTIEKVTPYLESIEDAPGLAQVVQDAASYVEEFAFVALVDENGKVFYHSTPGVQGNFDDNFKGLEGEEGIVRRRFFVGDNYLIYRSVPLPGDDSQLLYIVVAEPASVVDPPLWTLIPAFVGIISAILLALVLRGSMNRLILEPLKELAEGARILGAGNLDYEISLERGDEFGVVAGAFNEMALQLRGLVDNLEERVEERTQALYQKTKRLKAASIVSREASRVQNVPLLLETTVNAISENFGFYHAGIFLLDEAKVWAVLRAASSDGGKRMVQRGHRLKVGAQGIVGFVAGSGLPRIALNVGEDAVWFNNPDLPETRSEIGIPMKLEGEVLGILNVQSQDTEAFNEEDVDTLQLMADQVTIALSNARLLDQTKGALGELEELQEDYTRRGWARLAARLRPKAYEYNRVDVSPVPPFPVPSDLRQGRVSHKVVMDGGMPVMLEPMRVKDQVVGYLGLSDPQRIWTAEEIALVESISDQVGLALDGARLFEDAQRTARQQALLNQVLRLAATPGAEPEQILRDIVAVLGQGLGMAIGLFTFLDPQNPQLHMQAFVSADGLPLLQFVDEIKVLPDQHIFLQGLTRPELGKMLPLVARGDNVEAALSEFKSAYETERVLYVPVRTAQANNGFIAMLQPFGAPPLDPDTRKLAQNLANQIAVVMDNLGLAEEMRRSAEELSLLYDAGLELSAILDLDEMLEQAAEWARRIFESPSAVVYVKPEDSDIFFKGESLDTGLLPNWQTARQPRPSGMTQHILSTAESFLIRDNREDAKVRPELVNAGIVTQMGVPLLSGKNVLGAFFVNGVQPGQFDDHDVQMLEFLGTQVATALQNVRLYQEAAQSTQELRLLYEAGLQLAALLDVQEVLDQAADWARKIFNSPQATVVLRNPITKGYLMGESRDPALPKSGWGESSHGSGWEGAPRAGGMTEYILTSGESFLVKDNREQPESRLSLIEAGLISQMGVPLRLGQEALGVFFVNGTEVAQFNDHDVGLLEFLGTQVAAALQGALRFGETQSALAVVERQARYQTNVSTAVALLAERGTSEGLPDVLNLLGAAAAADSALYFESYLDQNNEPFWAAVASWSQDNTFEIDIGSRMRHLPVGEIPFWAEQIQQRTSMAFYVHDLPTPEHEIFEQLGFSSLLALAVHRGEIPVPSFIAIARHADLPLWQEEEIAALQTAASALANTLAREQLLEQVRMALDDANTLYNAGAALNTVQSYEGVLDVMLEHTILKQGVLSIIIVLFDRPWVGNRKPDTARILARKSQLLLDVVGLQFSLSVFGKPENILKPDRPTWIEDIEGALESFLSLRAEDQPLFEQLLAKDVNSTLFVPLVVANQWIGYLEAFYPEPFSISERANRQLMTLAQQAAVVIQNIYQLRVTQARARREQTIREIVGQIQSAPDVQGVLQAAVRELGRAFGTPRNFVQLQLKRDVLSGPEDDGKSNTAEVTADDVG
ncbi:MAG: GAF domain-containing protein [Anaerolineae bacterium]|nr:GAF domain-containing protein [Anaerolineae bacterium]